MKLPMYNSLMQDSEIMGVPIVGMQGLGIIAMILFLQLGKLAIVPTIFIFVILKIVSKKDKKFLEIYFINAMNNFTKIGF